ncbi:hypothetical protein [Vibrio phage JSF13]|uniref:Uncharacterized protein ORF12 n=1 Tax=Vibrio phage ICP1 TaxID=979525 RepID=F1D134_9CAUD|nr:hypothetical protein ViPhICP1_gp012 [Vibrio phage ICP1]ADX88057.1 hypothetical protein TUST1-191_00055 [Vibrio phage ICP1_2006_D]ADX88284.1 hypothetical protein TUST1-182_00055 [Vibrio phage ICP1_2006_C]ADX88511.1 hypothetical protein TUST1-159_00055 [Vibrio phage ICP1_2006_B]ADX88737.1 hypothetical protein TUST1-17_00055 [Vibrio phage ICP1_2006_A]ADX88963.1 hypothetical protein TUST1-15_00055 [Vibrio phage ICP1_2005_A]ADX89193.1 hypothetical protein TUST1-2_00055 [Vibrio phage ICP1_2001_A
MKTLNKTYKAYNTNTLKSVKVTGYHLVKELLKYGVSLENVAFFAKSKQSIYNTSFKTEFGNLHIDLVK